MTISKRSWFVSRRSGTLPSSLEYMDIEGNTVLITGGGSGIGRGLAEALHRAGNRVVIAGRRREALAAVATANPGLEWRQLDLTKPESITGLVAELADSHPALNVLVNNAGVMPTEDLLSGGPTETIETAVAVNLLGPMRLTAALLPTLLGHPQAAILNVTSALAFVPKADAPTYSATKAGLHAYTQALRHQLRNTAVQVVEIIPPRVETDMLTGQDSSGAMSIDGFVAETIALLQGRPDAAEIVPDAAARVRFADLGGHYDDVFGSINR